MQILLISIPFILITLIQLTYQDSYDSQYELLRKYYRKKPFNYDYEKHCQQIVDSLPNEPNIEEIHYDIFNEDVSNYVIEHEVQLHVRGEETKYFKRYLKPNNSHNVVYIEEYSSVDTVYDTIERMGGANKVQFIDLNSEDGIHTIGATLFKVPIISVNNNLTNLRLLQKTILKNKINYVTLLYNEIGFKRGKVRITKKSQETVNRIFINDLLPLISQERSIYIRLNLRKDNIQSIRYALNVLRERHVDEISTSINLFQKSLDVLCVLQNEGYKPYDYRYSPLDFDINNWPMDIYWRRKQIKKKGGKEYD